MGKIVKMDKHETGIRDICNVIKKWIESNEKDKKEVQFIGSFVVHDPEKNYDVVDNRMIAYGVKETLLVDLSEMVDMLEEEEEFVNW